MTPPIKGLLRTNPRGLHLMSRHVMARERGIGSIGGLEIFGVVFTRFDRSNSTAVPYQYGLSHSVFVRTDESETHSGSYFTSGDDV